jgi:hypothetical protein
MLPHGVASEVEISIILVICHLIISFNLELWRQYLGGPKKKSYTKGGILCSLNYRGPITFNLTLNGLLSRAS